MEIEAGTNVRRNALIDSSSTILLFKAGLLEKVIEHYNICMTESVYDELTRCGHEGSQDVAQYRRDQSITVLKCPGMHNMPGTANGTISSLDRGERDTIKLFLQGVGDLILLDDGKGALYCRKNELPFINALLVPRILHIARMISGEECECKTMSIIGCGRYSEKIIEYARSCPDEKLLRFV